MGELSRDHRSRLIRAHSTCYSVAFDLYLGCFSFNSFDCINPTERYGSSVCIIASREMSATGLAGNEPLLDPERFPVKFHLLFLADQNNLLKDESVE